MQSTTTRFSDEEYEALVAIAEQQERSQNDIIREALRSHPDIQTYLKAKKTQDLPQKPA
jgi:predicted transcriptional regulator